MSEVTPDRYPKWLLGDKQGREANSVRDAFEWVTIYEYYDRETNQVKHYLEQGEQVVFEDEIDYIPYSMFSLNQSGVDCLGLSEVQLVLNQQETINRFRGSCTMAVESAKRISTRQSRHLSVAL